MYLVRRMFGLGLSTTPWTVLDEDNPWNKKAYDELIEKVSETKPRNRVKKLNILVMGPQGYGKSTFINSIASLSVGEKTSVCNTGGKAGGEDVTTIHRQYDVPGRFKNFRFLDVRGLTKVRDHSLNYIKDLEMLIEGKMKEGYKFSVERPISIKDECFNENPSIETKVHGVIIVFDMSEAYDIHIRIAEDLRLIVNNLNTWNVPVSVVLTKADKENVCVQDDIENIYYSKKVTSAAENIYQQLGISKGNIHPVMNFGENVKFGWKEGLPLLRAIKACLNTARDHLYNADKDSRLPEE